MPLTYKEADQLQTAREAVDGIISNTLKRRGWQYTCDTPGSLWLWRKEITYRGNSYVALVDAKTALHMEQNL